MKRIVSVFLTIILTISLLPGSQISVEAKISSGFKYEIHFGKAYITGYTGKATNLSIPSKLAGYSVIEVEEEAFLGNKNLISVKLAEGIDTIGFSAFAYCVNLKKMILPKSLEYIEADALYFCKKLTSINLPSNLDGIEEYAFYGCQSLRDISIPRHLSYMENNVFEACDKLNSFKVDTANKKFSSSNGILYDKAGTVLKKYPEGRTTKKYKISSKVRTIDESAFAHSDNLKEIIIPDNVKEIRAYAFASCNSLNFMTIPETITTMGYSVFSNCKSLNAVKLPSKLKNLGPRSFANCKNLSVINLPETLLEIPHYCFMNCTNLSTVQLPQNLKKIRDMAFYGCTNMKTIDIPKNVNSIWYAFSGCTSMTSINVDADNLYYSSNNGILYDKEMTKLVRFPCGKETLEIIPESVTEIGSYSFSECKKLKEITIPKSILKINGNAFYDCTKLQDINFSEGLLRIEQYAFEDCISLKSVELPASLNYFDHDYQIFGGCVSLTDVNVSESNNTFSSINGVVLNKNKTVVELCPEGKSGKYVVPETVTKIASSAFESCKKLTQVILPKKLSTIEDDAFWQCEGLRSIVFPKSVQKIGHSAFGLCIRMKKALFLGPAPKLETNKYWDGDNLEPFYSCDKNFKVFYIYGNSGFVKNWSGFKTVATLPKPFVKLMKVDSSTINISWDKFKYATEYKIYMSESRDGQYELIGSTTEGSYAFTGAEAGKTYYFKVRSIRDVSGQNKIISDYSLAKSIAL